MNVKAKEVSGIIYLTRCLVNQKIYVGIFTGKDENYLGSGQLLIRAIKKYGRENFTRTTIDKFATIAEGCEKERYWIRELNSQTPAGYNLNGGGEGCFNPAPEVIAKRRLGYFYYLAKKGPGWGTTP
jgi:hypothetical protein